MLHFLRARRRIVTSLLALGCFLMLAYALFEQHRGNLEPCPLCIFQRVAVVALGVALLLAAAFPQRWRLLGNASCVLVALVGLAGAGISMRHLYIQSLPEGSVPACGASLGYMLDVFSKTEVLRKVLTGSGECARIDWTFLGLSMPGWVMICVVLIAALGVAANWRSRQTGWSRA
jgi:disulfide bond formation protein DsbB